MCCCFRNINICWELYVLHLAIKLEGGGRFWKKKHFYDACFMPLAIYVSWSQTLIKSSNLQGIYGIAHFSYSYHVPILLAAAQHWTLFNIYACLYRNCCIFAIPSALPLGLDNITVFSKQRDPIMLGCVLYIGPKGLLRMSHMYECPIFVVVLYMRAYSNHYISIHSLYSPRSALLFSLTFIAIYESQKHLNCHFGPIFKETLTLDMHIC